MKLLLAGLAVSALIQAQGDRPVARTDENSQIAHEQLLRKAKQGRIDIYFEGDSITRRWGATDYPQLLENLRQNFFTVLEPPEDILDAVRPPAEVSGVPSEEVLSPVFEQLRVVCSSPATRNGVTFEVDIDAPLLRFSKELFVCDLRVLVRSRNRPIALGLDQC